MVGTTVSHYRVLQLLGAGGMGVVYLAEDQDLQRKVALKFLSPALATDATAREGRLTAGHDRHTAAIRVNDQYRVMFRFEGHDAHDVRCTDYH